MNHEEVLFKAGEYRSGLLPAREREAIDRHLAGCRECRGLVARWKKAEPPAGFLDAVMADLPKADAPRRDEWSRWQLWGTLAAMVLIGLVFWRPEREWINADRSFAWMDRGPEDVQGQFMKEGRHE